MQEILNVFEEADDSNVAYNETMAYAVKSVADGITLDAEKLESCERNLRSSQLMMVGAFWRISLDSRAAHIGKR